MDKIFLEYAEVILTFNGKVIQDDPTLLIIRLAGYDDKI
jgi:hypothetical protein